MVPATVLEMHGAGRGSHIRITFRTTDGREVVADTYDFRWDPEPVVGGRMHVRYAPSDPAGTVQDARQRPSLVVDVWMPVVFGAAILILGVLLVRGSRPLIGERFP